MLFFRAVFFFSRALAQTHSLTSFGWCGWLERLGNVCGCSGLAYYSVLKQLHLILNLRVKCSNNHKGIVRNIVVLLRCSQIEVKVFGLGKIVKVLLANIFYCLLLIAFIFGKLTPKKLTCFPIFDHHVTYLFLVVLELEFKLVWKLLNYFKFAFFIGLKKV